MTLDVIIVQHAEKERTHGDPSLTALGHQQARQCGASLGEIGRVEDLWSSPLRRAVETAGHIASALGLPAAATQRDDRIRERMNWPGEPHQTREAFLEEWQRSTNDRDFRPSFGDLSRAAGDRFAAFLDERHATRPDGRILVVAHGGVTIDLVRTWFGDERVREFAPRAIEHGVARCGITRIELGERRRLLGIGVNAMDMEWESGPDETVTRSSQDRHP